MKKMKLNHFATILAVAVLSGCGGLNKMKDNVSEVAYTVTPKPLEVHGGEVAVTIETKFPPKYFNKKAVLTATPVLNYGAGEAVYESTTVQGESVEANNKVISNDGGSFTMTGSVPYQEEMLSSDLMMRFSAQVGDQSVDFPDVKIADGVIATSTLVEVTPKVILIGDQFQRVIPQNVEADIHYVIQRSDVRNSELRETDIDAFEEAIKAAKEDERQALKGMTISGYASPDGPMDLNDRLSENRQESAKRYASRELNRAKVEEAEAEEFFSLMTTAEDWEGFKELMQESDIEDKELILRVLSMYSDPQVREKEIRNISEAFEEIKDKILPKLRRSRLVLNIDKIGYSDEELAELVVSNPDTLNVEEILYAAALTEDADQKLSIYRKAAANFPDDVRTHNAVGYVLFMDGDVNAAKSSFEKAQQIEENDVVKNNLGAIALAEGNVEEAQELFTSAMGAGKVVNYNLGIINIMQGDYSKAVNYFGNEPSYNAALAKLLNGEPQAAISTLGSVQEDDAMVYYLKAIAGARSQQEDVVLNNLRTAINKDGSLKNRAQNDLEFAKYRDNEAFTSIVQ